MRLAGASAYRGTVTMQHSVASYNTSESHFKHDIIERNSGSKGAVPAMLEWHLRWFKGIWYLR